MTLFSSIAQDAKKYELKLFDPKWLVIGDMAHCTWNYPFTRDTTIDLLGPGTHCFFVMGMAFFYGLYNLWVPR